MYDLNARVKRYDFNFDLNSYTEDTDLRRRSPLNFSLDLECRGRVLLSVDRKHLTGLFKFNRSDK